MSILEEKKTQIKDVSITLRNLKMESVLNQMEVEGKKKLMTIRAEINETK